MRHSNAGKKFSRTPSHRKAMLRNLAKALLNHGRIRTTEVKAKELRGVVEPLITLALRNDLHARRQAYRVLGSHSLVKRLFDEIGPVFAGVPGGYTRVVKLAQPRRGDNAPLAFIELTRKPGEKAAPEKEKKPAMPAITEAPEAVQEQAVEAEAAPAEAEAMPAEAEAETLAQDETSDETLPDGETPPAEDTAEDPAKPPDSQKD